MRLCRARQRGESTDFTLICRSERFQVHKVVVCNHSRVLHTACTGPFKVRAVPAYLRDGFVGSDSYPTGGINGRV